MNRGDDTQWQHYSALGGRYRPHVFDEHVDLRRARERERKRRDALFTAVAWALIVLAFAIPTGFALHMTMATISDEEIRADPTRPGPTLPTRKASTR